MKKLTAIFFVCLLGCNPTDRSVGAACRDDLDCRDRCLENWPGGFCTMDCREDRDCPPDAVCSDRNGGVCLLPCRDNAECRDMMGSNSYVCDDVDNRGGGRDDVCVPD